MLFSFSFTKIKEKITSFIKPSLYMSGLGDVLKLWRSADTKDKGILLLVFSPMFLCIGGLVFSVIHFVLFVLPSFVFGVFGWGLLTVLFCSGGKYFYKQLTGHAIDDNNNKEQIIDVQFNEEPEEPEPAPKKARKKANDE
ncbi:MAG: hypothetical protein IJT58_00660 [Synergistaceae bacterium]|nr:hypothetical protein [Synergistaceae bacterium]